MAGEIACPRCGQPNDSGQRFCGSCGTSLSRACASCGAENPAGFAFCGHCGASLTTVAPLSSSEERRRATVLFGDLSGFTAKSEGMDPEDVRAMIDRCMNALGEIVERYGGRVERVTGDEIMVVFGAPVAHEDDPERAVRTALEMQRYATEQSEEFGGLALRIGVNTGEVMFAPVGPADARQFTVMGDAVNVAARLQAAALPGRVFVGEETYRAAHRSASFDEVDPIHAKGKGEPVRAWLAIEAEAPRARPLSEVPIVGRDGELDMLNSTWKRVVDERRPHLVTVIGSPGVGKTRLTFEFARSVEGEGSRVLRGRALPYGESSGYGAFAQQIKSAADVFETDPEDVALAKLNALIERVVEPSAVDEVAEHIAIAMGLAETATVVEKGPLFTSCRRLVECLARETPLLMVFEDVHWADATLLELVEFLASRLRETPVLLLALARPELHDVRPTWGGGLQGYTAIGLQPLPAASARLLAEQHLARLPGRETAERLASMAEGNPLFIEELAATVSEGAADGRLPTTIHGIIAARLDALPPHARSALLDASVVGKIFWRGALMRLGHGDVDAALDVLEQRDFIRRQPASRFEGDEEIAFKHMLIRDVAYDTVSRAVRRDRHAQVASFLEDAARERPRESASLLAHHWKEAGEIDRALSYIELAAEGARGAGALGEAMSLYDDALELVGDDPRSVRLRFRRARAMVQRGDYRGGADEIDQILDQLEGTDLADALVQRSIAAFWLGDAATLRTTGVRTTALGEQLGEQRLQSLGIGYLGWADQMDGDLDAAMRRADEAIGGLTPDSPAVERGMVLIQAGALQYWAGESDQAVKLLEEAFALGTAERYAEPALAGGANLALSLFGLGRHREAEEIVRQVDRLAPELELVPRLQGRAMNIWAGGMYDAGDFAAARELNERAIEMSGRAAFPVVTAQALADLLFALIAEGEFGRAESSVPAAREAATKVGGFHKWLLEVRLTQAEAELALGLGRIEDAADIATRALERKHGRRPKYEIAAEITLGRSLFAMGKADEAVVQLRNAMNGANTLKYPRSRWRVAGALAELLAKTGDDAGAEQATAERRRAIEEFADQLAPDRREAFLRWHEVSG